MAQFPSLSLSTLLQYKPNVLSRHGIASPAEVNADDMRIEETEISAAYVLEERIWVGFRTYSSEGSEGLGGLGFWDAASGEVGILRLPALVHCSVSDLLVTADSIFAKTIAESELGMTAGNGLVSIDRSTLEAIARVPMGDRGLWDKDDPTVRILAYETSMPNLIAYRWFVPHSIPGWREKEKEAIRSMGADGFMIHTAEAERQSK